MTATTIRASATALLALTTLASAAHVVDKARSMAPHPGPITVVSDTLDYIRIRFPAEGAPPDAPVVMLDAHDPLVEVEDCWFIPDKRTTYFDPSSHGSRPS
jgi:hypothetical protein